MIFCFPHFCHQHEWPLLSNYWILNRLNNNRFHRSAYSHIKCMTNRNLSFIDWRCTNRKKKMKENIFIYIIWSGGRNKMLMELVRVNLFHWFSLRVFTIFVWFAFTFVTSHWCLSLFMRSSSDNFFFLIFFYFVVIFVFFSHWSCCCFTGSDRDAFSFPLTILLNFVFICFSLFCVRVWPFFLFIWKYTLLFSHDCIHFCISVRMFYVHLQWPGQEWTEKSS